MNYHLLNFLDVIIMHYLQHRITIILIKVNFSPINKQNIEIKLFIIGSSSTLCLEEQLSTCLMNNEFIIDTVEPTNLIDNSSSGAIENLIIPNNLIEEIQQEEEEFDRLIVSLDVNPYQKKRYGSDQQRIRQDTTDQKETKTTNGYLSRIQGIKAPDEKYKQVLPRISVKLNMRYD